MLPSQGRSMDVNVGSQESDYIWRHHRHELEENQCSSVLVKRILAPVNVVWAFVRRFDQPQQYKPFVRSCTVRGDLTVGSIRDVNVTSGLPATSSTERLEVLDDAKHVFSYRILGGDHRLKWMNSEVLPIDADLPLVDIHGGSTLTFDVDDQ
eukprot:c26920_g4_i2 orf=595-1050(+)